MAKTQEISSFLPILRSGKLPGRTCQTRVGVWVCGCVGVWVCGCVGVWVCGCVGVWVCGCVGVWVSAPIHNYVGSAPVHNYVLGYTPIHNQQYITRYLDQPQCVIMYLGQPQYAIMYCAPLVDTSGLPRSVIGVATKELGARICDRGGHKGAWGQDML
jgi:hypothetical protein